MHPSLSLSVMYDNTWFRGGYLCGSVQVGRPGFHHGAEGLGTKEKGPVDVVHLDDDFVPRNADVWRVGSHVFHAEHNGRGGQRGRHLEPECQVRFRRRSALGGGVIGVHHVREVCLQLAANPAVLGQAVVDGTCHQGKERRNPQ